MKSHNVVSNLCKCFFICSPPYNFTHSIIHEVVNYDKGRVFQNKGHPAFLHDVHIFTHLYQTLFHVIIITQFSLKIFLNLLLLVLQLISL